VGWSFVYLGLCRLIQLVVLLCRSERSKELEILRGFKTPVPPAKRVISEHGSEFLEPVRRQTLASYLQVADFSQRAPNFGIPHTARGVSVFVGARGVLKVDT
jgi:hypothetical protein